MRRIPVLQTKEVTTLLGLLLCGFALGQFLIVLTKSRYWASELQSSVQGRWNLVGIYDLD